jgi:hypothetical protein
VTDRPTWAILIPTISPREELFQRLLRTLLPQLDAHGGLVRVIAWRNDGHPSVGEIRDGLLARAHETGAEYVSFVDDDDLVSNHYVDLITEALAERPDHVGFQMEFINAAGGHEIVDHSLRHGRWARVDGQLRRDFTHVDPIRTEHARRGRFANARAGRAEDRAWVKQIRPLLRTEVYIDKILYRYLWSAETSAWQRPEMIVPSGTPRPVVDHPYFSWHPLSDA